MVYYKRKPVQLVSRPEGLKDTDDVWVIAETNEVFQAYDSFLQRMNFYKQKQFVCEGTGHSCLTFFEALESERHFAEEVDRTFPESLKEPVLRRVQFSTTSRIDRLVDQVYEEFKSDFYPGERVTVLLEDGTRLQGTVREKARFPEVLDKNGNVSRRAFSKYLVKLMSRDNEEALLADEHLVRDRKIFTKAMLRGFIKNSVQRESWTGAPWMVKEAVAEKYHIDTQIPKHLQFEQSKTATATATATAGGGGTAKIHPATVCITPVTEASEMTISNITTPRNYLKDGTKPTQGMFGLFASGDTEIGPRGGIKAGVKRKKRPVTQQDISRDTEQSYIAYQKTLNGKPEFTVDYSQDIPPTVAPAAAPAPATAATTPRNVTNPAPISTPSTPSMPQPFIIHGRVSDLNELAEAQTGFQRPDPKHFDHISVPTSGSS
ncbi:hypothetical protein KEM54_002384 [Ascosphaera aggregata]|nr:hypothetical protein KEM54_002384 [Ascosphaera aggregata]